ncbi:MAG: sulfite exporter TauE/SafE family protein [Porticoccaceae bacterium]|nr:sulfite exporter TauE/SafE family protein [Porticoccaceae bacterium]
MAIFIGLIIGLVLGLTGAGGSIFAVPLLILFLDLSINEAIGIALGAVAASALIGSLSNWRSKSILWVPALALGSGGTIIAPLGKELGRQLPPTLLLIGFCTLASIVALLMWRQTLHSPEKARIVRSINVSGENTQDPLCRLNQNGSFNLSSKCFFGLIVCGLLVGLLSGLFGVGGGFLIVPALLFTTRISMLHAVATSLLIISVISASGFTSFVMTNPSLDWTLLSQICLGGLLGMLTGRLLAKKIAGIQLQRTFAGAVLAMIAITLVNGLS